MPTFEYDCPDCGKEFDRWCKASERENQKCECGSTGKQVIRTAPVPHWTSLAMGSSASPEAIKRFDKMRREQANKESKTMKEHGDYGKAPGS